MAETKWVKERLKRERFFRWCYWGAAFGFIYTIPIEFNEISVGDLFRALGGSFGGVILFGLAAFLKNKYS